MSLRCAELAACRQNSGRNSCRQVERSIKSGLCGSTKISAEAHVIFFFPSLCPHLGSPLTLQLHHSSTPRPLSSLASVASLPHASAGQGTYFKRLTDFASDQQVPEHKSMLIVLLFPLLLFNSEVELLFFLGLIHSVDICEMFPRVVSMTAVKSQLSCRQTQVIILSHLNACMYSLMPS